MSNNGKYIWIIGASSGIGEAMAKYLAEDGATLALSARSGDKLRKIIKGLPGENHIAVPLDISDVKATHKAFTKIKTKFKKLDSAVFMAAIYAPHSKKSKDIDFIHDMINVNLGGAYNLLEAVRPYFERRKKGQIVLCGSVAGYRGLPFGQPYCSTKAGIINLAESLRIELAKKNVTVQVINPGFVKTPLTDKNDFPMPMMISAEKAGQAIAKGMAGTKFEIHFPKRFTYIMKFLELLPRCLYFKIMSNVKIKS